MGRVVSLRLNGQAGRKSSQHLLGSSRSRGVLGRRRGRLLPSAPQTEATACEASKQAAFSKKQGLETGVEVVNYRTQTFKSHSWGRA